MKPKILRITTVPISLKYLLTGQMLFMSENGFEIIMISSDGPEIKELINTEKCKHETIPLTRKITPFKDLWAIFKLIILIIRHKPDIVHTHTPKAGMIGMISAFLTRVPIRIHTVAGLPLMEAKGFKRRILTLVERITYGCADKVYPNSQGLKDFILKSKFTKPEKLRVLGNGSSNGIDTSYFDPELFSFEDNSVLKTNLGINNNDFVFIFVGRIVSDKGINELVEAFDKICLVKKKLKLLLVGSFEDEFDPLQEKTKMLINDNNNIISVGHQNDVRPYFSISNCLVFPSYREGFPNVVMQAGAMKLASIVSNINGCNEIVKNNINGILIETKSVDSIYHAMLKIASDGVLFERLKSNSRTFIRTKYERKVFWNLLLNEYKSILNKHSK